MYISPKKAKQKLNPKMNALKIIMTATCEALKKYKSKLSYK